MNTTTNSIERILVLSDTHLADTHESRLFLRSLIDMVAEPIDMIFHAGDVVAPELLEVFSDLPCHVVRGNMDSASPDVPIKKVIDVKGFKIGLIHGWGAAEGLENRILQEFLFHPLDCLVYGHSHRPVCKNYKGTLMFNPGSATDRRNMSYHSIGLLEIGSDIQGSIIRLD